VSNASAIWTYAGPQSAEENALVERLKMYANVALTQEAPFAVRYDTPYKKRARSAIMLAGLILKAADFYTLVAMGYRLAADPKLDLLFNLEQRATIRGGLAALKAAGIPGYDKVNIGALKSATFQSESDDKALYSIVKGKNLGDGVTKIRRIVKRYNLGEAAFAMRAAYILDDREYVNNAQWFAETLLGFLTGGISGFASAVVAALTGAFKMFVGDPFYEQVRIGAAEGLQQVRMPAPKKTPEKRAVPPEEKTVDQAVTEDLAIADGGPFGLPASWKGIDMRYILAAGAIAVAGTVAIIFSSDD
jgi:hypothetical protein